VFIARFGLGGLLVKEGYMWNTHEFFGCTTDFISVFDNHVQA